jgi:hypothetical protein
MCFGTNPSDFSWAAFYMHYYLFLVQNQVKKLVVKDKEKQSSKSWRLGGWKVLK